MAPDHESLRDGSRVERYLAHLDELSGGVEPRFLVTASTHPTLKDVISITYSGLPEAGLRTAFTYGVSLADHIEWRLGKPELCISVRSEDDLWARAVGFIAEHLRGECPFAYGDTLNFGATIAPESAMTCFVIFAPAVLAREGFLGIDLGDELPINIAGCYPIYASERRFIQTNGLATFWELTWDPYDVRRPAVA